MNRYNLYFHIHIISTQISELTKIKLTKIGYISKSFLFFEENGALPFHYCCKTKNYSDIIQLWFLGVEILKRDESFIGHISRETISDKFITRYLDETSEDFVLSKSFPLINLNAIDIIHDPYKKADLHVKRSLSKSKNDLDLVLVKTGFSEVWTTENRIYTIQIESVRDAKNIFKLLKKYFDEVGGINQLSFEIVNEVIKFPTDLKMTKVLAAGSTI